MPIKRSWTSSPAGKPTSAHSLTLPAFALVGTALILPLLWLLWQSFIGRDGWTFENYLIVFRQPHRDLPENDLPAFVFLDFDLYHSRVSVLLRDGHAAQKLRADLQICVGATFFASYLVRTYSWLLSAAAAWHPQHVSDRTQIHRGAARSSSTTSKGTLLGMVHILLPLMVFPLFASMKTIDRTLLNAAAALGATPSRAFRDVFLPLSLPGVIAGSVLVFVLSLGFFLTPAIMGGGRVVVWATAIATAAEENSVWGASSALGIILLVVTFSVLYALKRLFRIDKVLHRAT